MKKIHSNYLTSRDNRLVGKLKCIKTHTKSFQEFSDNKKKKMQLCKLQKCDTTKKKSANKYVKNKVRFKKFIHSSK